MANKMMENKILAFLLPAALAINLASALTLLRAEQT
jgi:hypothetical protein